MIRQWRRWRGWLAACPKSQKGAEMVCSMPKVTEGCRDGLQHAQSHRRVQRWFAACPKPQKGAEVVCSMPKVAERCRGGLQHAQSHRKVQRWLLGIDFEVMCLGVSLVQVFCKSHSHNCKKWTGC